LNISAKCHKNRSL